MGESDRERKLLDTSSTAVARKQSGQSLSRVLKRQGFEGPLKTHDLKASESDKTHAFSTCNGLHKRLRLLSTHAHALPQALT